MAYLLLPHSHRRCIWTPLPELINEEKYRTARVGGSEYLLKPEQIVSWTNFADEVKSLVAPFCGTVHDFAPIVPSESFGVANEIGVQGRFVQNALHPVGDIVKLLRFGVSFGDSQWGVHRKKDDEGEKSSRVAGRGTTLFPDIVVVENKKHHIRSLAEIKTYWAFKPHEKQTWDEFLADKLGQLARYMDDHYCRFGFYTTYQQTWFLKRVDDTHFAVSEPISASATSTVSAVSLRECILATAIRATDARGSYYGVRHGKELVSCSMLVHGIVVD
ncbi:uncharacterized protein BO88DRAFT_343977 [Aspergillus vadensis CBS 113365]|uniref:Fungal-type protein kinase domain-containing protein n=1 Tax=Aspergillus vadensis (strain CBS 113365 / IMI 142717 / IBT 24658) TaxID=1448311 RepID=A0A319BAG8_ASPVC|nr:hypothetical protein BO88DRAFT_343977 [Aspergillus vadensis CBS 113365]PYH67490.1 hypothetical protein BO88DRAFT_343977 [Aspergillus vadensis CBS 113365]